MGTLVQDRDKIEALVAEGEGWESPAAMEILRRQPDPGKVLSELSKSRNVHVRGWVVVAAQEVLGADATSLLTGMLDDPDADTRVLAMSAIEDVDPAAIAKLTSRLRGRLSSSNPSEALATSWTLAQLGDLESIPLLERYRDEFEDVLWQHKAAEVVLLYMTDPAEVIRRVRDHDHDRMMWLVHGAKLLGTPDAIAALRECASGAPDAECRAKCSYQLLPEG